MDENNNAVATNNQIQTLPNPNGYGQYQVRDYGPPAPYYDGEGVSSNTAIGFIGGMAVMAIGVACVSAFKKLKNKYFTGQPNMQYDPRFGQQQNFGYQQAPPQNGGMFEKYDQMRQNVYNTAQPQYQQAPPQNVQYQQPNPVPPVQEAPKTN